MSSGSRGQRITADLDIAGGVRAAEAQWERTARTARTTTGEVEIDELREREPEHPDPGRTYRNVQRVWAFRAWVADMAHRHSS